jgi:hypothetical protein
MSKLDALDRCYSPDNLAQAIAKRCLERELVRPGDVVLDAGVGEGVFYDAFEALGLEAWGIDIDPLAPALLRPATPKLWCGDLLEVVPGPDGSVGLVAGNPPFSLAEEFVIHGLKIAPTVAFLLPNLFLGAATRYDSGFWDRLVHFDPLVERAGFHGPGVEPDKQHRGGNAQHALFVWQRYQERNPRREFTGRHIAWGGMKHSTKANKPKSQRAGVRSRLVAASIL